MVAQNILAVLEIWVRVPHGLQFGDMAKLVIRGYFKSIYRKMYRFESYYPYNMKESKKEKYIETDDGSI